MSNFFFSHCVFKRLVLQTCKTKACFGKGLRFYCTSYALIYFRSKLNHNAALLQLPIGLENDLEGVIDLIEMQALYFHEPQGLNVVRGEIPDHMKSLCEAKRQELIGQSGFLQGKCYVVRVQNDYVYGKSCYQILRCCFLCKHTFCQCL